MIIRFSNDSKFLIIGTLSGKCYFVRSSNLKIVCANKIHYGCISILKVLRNNQILTCSNDKSIKLSEIFSKKSFLK